MLSKPTKQLAKNETEITGRESLGQVFDSFLHEFVPKDTSAYQGYHQVTDAHSPENGERFSENGERFPQNAHRFPLSKPISVFVYYSFLHEGSIECTRAGMRLRRAGAEAEIDKYPSPSRG